MATASWSLDAERVRREAVRPVELLASGRPWRQAWFLFLNLVLGVFWFTLVLLVPAGIVLIIGLIGFPIMAALMAVWTRGAQRHRRRIGKMSGRRINDPYRPPVEGFFVRRLWAKAFDPAVWRDLLYLVLLFPIGAIEFGLVLFVAEKAIEYAAMPFYYWWWSDGVQIGPDWTIDTFGEAIVVMAIGAALVWCWPLLVGWMTRLHVAFAQTLLGPSTTELAERVDVLTKSRSGVMEAMLLERRRIERDLHDGAQQRLVALAMDLGMAKEKLKTDPEAARQLVESSHEEAKRVLSDLRDLVRGIYPAVLTDRGLDAAISSVAGRSPVMVTVDVELRGRPPEAVEATAYFVVVEALTNVAKHSGATEAKVWVRSVDDRLAIEVTDNGTGGADAKGGTGLGGLADRIAALDGELTIDSPPGGPTRVRAEIPVGE
ncbi:MAG TPA: sensor histidine kinase [Thermomicrobiales bacterium]|nr:sensor histidine kinase [Thermomicrobiales bacterium]